MRVDRGLWYPTLATEKSRKDGAPSVVAGRQRDHEGLWYPTLALEKRARMGHPPFVGWTAWKNGVDGFPASLFCFTLPHPPYKLEVSGLRIFLGRNGCVSLPCPGIVGKRNRSARLPPERPLKFKKI